VSEPFREAMRTLASGLVVVTTWVDGRPWGLTISSCCSVSAEPAQLLVSLRTATVSCQQALLTQRFGVSLLAEGQRDVAERGALPGAPKFLDGLVCTDGEHEHSPRVRGALHHLECRATAHVEAADHTIVIGTVERCVAPPAPQESRPLLYFDRAFHALGAGV
jgi:flavin reductase ActVB